MTKSMAREPVLKEVDRAARDAGIPPEQSPDSGRDLGECKRCEATGTKNNRGDLTCLELLDKANRYKQESGRGRAFGMGQVGSMLIFIITDFDLREERIQR